MLIEMVVQRGHINVNVGVILLHALNAFGRADDAHELDMLCAGFLEKGDRRRGRAAGCEHRVNNDDVALGNIGGHLEVVLNWLKRFRIAEQTDVTDLDVGHHAHHAVNHAKTRTQYGNDRQLFSSDAMALCNGDRGFDLYLLQRKIPGGLIAHQHCDLGDDLAEFLHAGLLIAQDGQLMLNKRMVEYAYFAHVLVLL